MTPKTPPGETREKIYTYVRQRLFDGLPPTVREIQQHFGFRAVQTAQEHLKRLVAEGKLIKQKGKARGYTLPEMTAVREQGLMLIPLIGRVPAGGLDAAIEDTEGYIPVQTRGSGAVVAPPHAVPLQGTNGISPQPRGARPPHTGAAYEGHGLRTPYQPTQPGGSGQLFALRVHGDSMIGAGILPGDIVIVRSQPTAQSGDIVVALIGDEATVKRLRLRQNRIELHPENPAFEPIIPGPDECTILGKVIEARRYFETPAL
jgi:repressor LexA